MVRVWLRDDQFERIAALLPGKASDPGRTAADNRLFVEAVCPYRLNFDQVYRLKFDQA